jgi:hypothetical protein
LNELIERKVAGPAGEFHFQGESRLLNLPREFDENAAPRLSMRNGVPDARW